MKNHAGLLTNKRDGMSVISFSFPAMWSGVRGEVPLTFMCRASAHSNCIAMRDPFAASLRTQPTVGELSLNSAVYAALRTGQTVSITSHKRNKPDISRSKFVIFFAL